MEALGLLSVTSPGKAGIKEGHPGEKDPWQTLKRAGGGRCPTLLGVPAKSLRSPELRLQRQLSWAEPGQEH